MAILTGIQGMNMTAGTMTEATGKIALSIKTQVLRILADMDLTYLFATVRNPETIKAGTATYYVPEIVSTEDYGDGSTPFNTIGAGLVSLDLNTRRTVKYEYEEFDVSRLNESQYILGMISNGVAMSIQADLNSQFLEFLKKKFDKTTGDNKMKTQRISLKKLGGGEVATTPDEMWQDYLTLEYKMTELSATFDKNKLGIPMSEFFAILSPKCDVGMRVAFRNQPNSIGNWQIKSTLVGSIIGNFRYKVDKMLDKNIGANKSFKKEAFDTTAIWGFLLHTEAVAMPMNLQSIHYLVNPENGNPRFIAKYQFGIGVLRPDLCYIIEKGE